MELLTAYRSETEQKKLVNRAFIPPYRVSGTNEISSSTVEPLYNPVIDLDMTELQQEIASVQETPFLAPLAAFEKMGNTSQQRQIRIIYREFVNNFKFLIKKDQVLLKSFPIHCFFYNENTIGIEWNLNKLIVTFDIEEEPEESCWSITSVQSAGGYNVGDYFTSGKDVRSVTKKLADMVIQQLDNLL